MITARKYLKITIDHNRCTVPFLCKKCLQVCPEGVFWVERVVGREMRLKEMDPRIPENYKLFAVRYDKCTMCDKCIDVCPVDAIRIEIS